MSGQKKTSPGIGKILYGIGGLSSVTEVVFLLLFLPEFQAVNEISLLIAALLGIALPVFLMPIAYALINGNMTISTGRYHLPMVVSQLLSVLSFVVLLSVEKGHPVAQAFALFGLLFLFSLTSQVFSYTYFSIGRRFDQSDSVSKLRNIFSMVSVALAAVLMLLLGEDSRDSIRAIVAIAAIVAVLSLVCVYMGTVRSMPNFIRLEPHHKRSIKAIYARFTAPLKNRVVLLFSVATFMACIGIGIMATTIPEYVFTYMFGRNMGYKPAVLILAALIAPAGYLVTRLLQKKGDKAGCTLAVVLSSVQVVGSVAVVVLLSVPVPSIYKAVVLFAFSALSGGTLGTVFAVEARCKDYAVRLSDCTPGKYSCLRTAVAALGLAVGVACSAVLRIVGTHVGAIVAAVVACALYAAFVLGSVLVCRMGFADKLWRMFSHKEEDVSEEGAHVHD